MKTIILLLILVMLSVSGLTASAFSGTGSGIPSDPFMITSCAQLQEIGDEITSSYALENNVDCSVSASWNSGAGFDPIDDFEGTLDGRGFIVDKLTINRGGTINIGLFGSMSDTDVIIKDIGLTDVNITCQYYCGAFAGYMSGILSGSFSTGTISSTHNNCYNAGLVGVNIGTIRDSWTACHIIGQGILGGLVGLNAGLITDVYSMSNVTGTPGADRGGLCPLQIGGTMSGVSFFNTDKSTLSNFVSRCAGSSYGVYEFYNTSAEMQDPEIISTWNSTLWEICTRDNAFPSLKAFGLCCVPSWSCSKYTACGQNNQDCLVAKDLSCGYEFNRFRDGTYDASLDGNMSQFSRNCSMNAQTPDVSLMNFDLRYSTNVMILGLFIFLWLALVIIAFAFHSQNFGLMSFIVAILVGLLLIQVHVVLTLLFILMNVVFVTRFGKRLK